MATALNPYGDLAELTNEQLAIRLETANRVHSAVVDEIHLRKTEGFWRRWRRGDIYRDLSWFWSPGTTSKEAPWLGGYWPPNPFIDRNRTAREIESILVEMKRRGLTQ